MYHQPFSILFHLFCWAKLTSSQAAKTSGGSDAGRPLDSKIRQGHRAMPMGRVVLPLEIGVVTEFDGTYGCFFQKVVKLRGQTNLKLAKRKRTHCHVGFHGNGM